MNNAKRILALILAGLCLLGVIAPIAFAEEVPRLADILFDNFPRGGKGMIHTPVINYVSTDTGDAIACTYKPDEFSLFLSSKYVQDTYKLTQWDTVINVWFKFDNNDWVNYDDASPSVKAISTLRFTKTEPITADQTLVFLDFRKYIPDRDVDHAFTDILENKDGKYVVDWSKHKLQVKFVVDFEASHSALTMFTSEVATLHIPAQDKLPQISAPTITDAYFNDEKRVVYYQAHQDENTQIVAAAGHNIDTLVKYTINGVESGVFPVSLGKEAYHALTISKKYIPDSISSFTIHVAFRDLTTNTISAWSSAKVKVSQSVPPTVPDIPPVKLPDVGGADPVTTPPETTPQSPDSTPSDTTGDNNTSDTPDHTETTCNICGQVHAQPLGMCLWIFIGIIVCAATAVVCTVIILVSHKKNKE